MSTVKEIKENQLVVKGVGDFATSLQQIAASRMVRLRKQVLAAKRFAQESVIILRELEVEREKKLKKELEMSRTQIERPKKSKDKKFSNSSRTAIIIVTTDQGLCGSYNTEVFKKIDEIAPAYSKADYFVIGSKGQEYFKKVAKKHAIKFYPYNLPEKIEIENVRPLASMFYRYDQIYLLLNQYQNTTTRNVAFLELVLPHIETTQAEIEAKEGEFIFEPNLEELIKSISAKLKYALFRQQLLDSKLALYSAQMIAMQTASDNAKDLLLDLKHEYNKARRKLIDKKIQEVQAGRSLWAQ